MFLVFNFKYKICMQCNVVGNQFVWSPIWFQDQREQCAHNETARGGRQRAPGSAVCHSASSWCGRDRSFAVTFSDLATHLLQFLLGFLDCHFQCLGLCVWTSCTSGRCLSYCTFCLWLQLSCFADLDVQSPFRKIDFRIPICPFVVRPGVHSAIFNVDLGRLIGGDIAASTTGAHLRNCRGGRCGFWW